MDRCPERASVNGVAQATSVELLLLRVFCQAWGIAGQPTAEDFLRVDRLVESAPSGMEVDGGIVSEIRAVLDLHRMSTALSRVEGALDRLTPLLPEASGDAVRKSVRELRRLMKKPGARRAAPTRGLTGSGMKSDS
jgi:hypothetical protein